MKRVFIFLVLVLCFPFLLADTTFFEGDSDYRDDFMMASLPEEIVAAVVAGVEVLQSGGSGGYFLREEFNQTIVCPTCTDSLRSHIREYQSIDYNEEQITILTKEINEEFVVDLSNNQVRYIIENFEDECDSPYPILGAVAGGRFRDLTSPLLVTIIVVILIFFAVIGYFIIRALRKIRSGNIHGVKRKKVKKKKLFKSRSRR